MNKKTISLFLSFCLIFNLFGQAGFALAKPEKPAAPTPPSNPLDVTPTPTPTTGEANNNQENTEAESKPSKPSKPQSPNPPLADQAFEPTGGAETENLAETRVGSDAATVTTAENSGNGAFSENTATTNQTTETTISQENKLNIENNFQIEVDTGDNFANYSVGDVEILTGDANTSLTLLNSGNENTVSLGDPNLNTQNSPSASWWTQNSQNGAFSENTATSKSEELTTINTKNSAELKNNFAVSTETGGNSANFTTDGDAKVQTGNAGTTINVINFANTNGVEVAIKEFNILDDQAGDIVLDFSDAQTIAANSGNGTGSTNETTVDDTGTIVITNKNDGKVQNEIIVNTDTGGNNANFTTSGDASIQTGDANIIVNVINFLNNNLTAVGEVIVGVVNIFGNLVGNLILPGNAVNLGNGAGSINSATITAESSETIIQSNTADIENTVELTANTGDNNANYNTGGNVQITTGETNLKVGTTTIANENLLAGGDTNEPIYVVLINEMGKWVGKVLGMTNEGNGAGSENSAELSSTAETTITQENLGEIKNNVLISANTGDNSTSYITNGNANIETGDVNVLTNIVNFLNNNFVGRKIILSIVNVFGSWLGDIGSEENFATTESTETKEEDTKEIIEEVVVETTEDTSNPELIPENTTSSNLSNSQNTLEPEPSLPSTPSSETNGSSETSETHFDETESSTEVETEVETVLDLMANIGNGKVNLNQKLFSQSLTKKTITEGKKQVLTERPRQLAQQVSPWANRRLLPTITDEIKFEQGQQGLPWSFSSVILMALGLIAGILKRFFG